MDCASEIQWQFYEIRITKLRITEIKFSIKFIRSPTIIYVLFLKVVKVVFARLTI